jgi:hypothetical protein
MSSSTASRHKAILEEFDLEGGHSSFSLFLFFVSNKIFQQQFRLAVLN